MPGELDVNIEQNEEGDVQIYMDLEPYIEAFHNKDASPEEFIRLKEALQSKVTRASANLYWINIFDLCTEGMESEDVQALAESPASKILEEHLVEILMNSIDEAIQANHADQTYPPAMNMIVKLDADTDPGLVSFYLLDSGRGYPPKFRNKVQSTDDQRQQYICRTQRTENLQKVDAHVDESKPYDGPDLIGGHGLGMRHFLADAQNDKLVGHGPNKKLTHVYPKSNQSFLDFLNLQDMKEGYTGALIHLRTPISPRKTFAEIQEMQEQKQRELETPSPDTTVETVSTMGGLSIDTYFAADSSYMGHDEDFDKELSEDSEIDVRFDDKASTDPSKEEFSPKANKGPMLDMSFLDEKDDDDSDVEDDDSNFSPR